jgi:murein DD-endopeptidase MepM/ murein hydrolase activator NlpD
VGSRPSAHRGRSWRKTIGIAVSVAALCVSAGSALAAGSGGVGGGGGVGAPKPAKVTDVRCLSSCAGIRTATAGSKVQLDGKHLGDTRRVSFTGERGRMEARADDVSEGSVTAKVPEGAATGRPRAVDDLGNATPSERRLEIVAKSEIPDTAGFKLAEASAKPRTSYYYGKHKPSITYMFRGEANTDVRIEVVDRDHNTTVATWIEEGQEPYAENRASWSGRTDDGKLAKDGDYRFRVGSASSGAVETTDEAKFAYHGHKFPLPAHHTYGDGVGAPRSGHVHEGQDVMAKCGKKIVAARGGRVQTRDFQSLAGNYLVIDGKRDGQDYFYAHLKRRSPLKEGERVRTGERIGVVGQTGDATACHLHFEIWSAPGWYEGGHFERSVTKQLKRWDSWS